MSRRSEQIDEIRQLLTSMDTRMGQMSNRIDRLETRSHASRSHNRRSEPFSEKGENESYVEGEYVFHAPSNNNHHDHNHNYNNNRRTHYHNNNNNNNHNNHHDQNNERLGGNLKLTPPTFSGKVDPEGYLNWEHRMNNLFENFNYADTKKVAIATAQFTEHALSWWNHEVTEARRRGDRPITSWHRLTERMRTRYVPSHYHRELQNRFRKLTQGTKSVEEYFQEFEHLRNRIDVVESEESLMAQFLDGLQDRIAHKVERVPYGKLEDLLHLATKVEQQIMKKTASSGKGKVQIESSKFNRNESSFQAGKQGDLSNSVSTGSKTTPLTIAQQPRRPPPARDMICYKCQGRGHMSRDCPNQRTMIINPDGHYESQDEEDEPDPKDEPELMMAETGEMCSLVTRRILNSTVGSDPSSQRHNLFFTKCAVQSKICSLIIDGGSCTNVASKSMVDKLNLKTTPHPNPYKLQWLNDKAGLQVEEQVIIPFKIGNYVDDVKCDVIPMQASHILLGRPWQFDRKAVHYGRTNQYAIEHEGRHFRLAPLTPLQIRDLRDTKCELIGLCQKDLRDRGRGSFFHNPRAWAWNFFRPKNAPFQEGENDEVIPSSKDQSLSLMALSSMLDSIDNGGQ